MGHFIDKRRMLEGNPEMCLWKRRVWVSGTNRSASGYAPGTGLSFLTR